MWHQCVSVVCTHVVRGYVVVFEKSPPEPRAVRKDNFICGGCLATTW